MQHDCRAKPIYVPEIKQNGKCKAVLTWWETSMFLSFCYLAHLTFKVKLTEFKQLCVSDTLSIANILFKKDNFIRHDSFRLSDTFIDVL